MTLKLLVSGGLLYAVVSKTGIDKVASTLGKIDLLSFLTASLLYIFSIYLSSIRWRFLLPEGFRQRKLFSLYLIGSLFNNILPGIIGGDAVKAYYLNSELRGRGEKPFAPFDTLEVNPPVPNQEKGSEGRFEKIGTSLPNNYSSLSIAIASVFMDRYIGFAAMMFIGLMAFPFGFGYFRGSYIEWLLPLLIALFIAGSILVLWLRIGKRIGLLSELYDYFDLYRNRRSVIAKTFALSLLVQATGIFAVCIIGLGLGIRIPLFPLFIFIPIISTLSTIPISISGIGVREASFVLLFGFLGINPIHATAVSLAWFLSAAAGSLPGLYEYLRYKRRDTVS